MIPSFTIVLRKERVKGDLYPIYFQVCLNGKCRRYYLHLQTTLNHWDNIKGRAKMYSPGFATINGIIEKYILDAQTIFLEHKVKNQPITLSTFEGLFIDRTVKTSFYSFAESEIVKMRKEASTIQDYRFELSKLKKFKPNLNTSDVSVKFINEYHDYMAAKLHNSTNTIGKSMNKLKVFTRSALNKGLIDHDPFREYKIKHEHTTRSYLTIEELELIEKSRQKGLLSESEVNVCDYFLFSCYTGLRYQDLRNLTWDKIENNTIRLTMQKTRQPVMIPLTTKSLKYLPFTKREQNEKVFRVVSNKKTNERLKSIISKAGITKQISFHNARHTFATIALTIGIPIETIRDFLGHSDLKTTQVYAKIIDQRKVDEMKKFDY